MTRLPPLKIITPDGIYLFPTTYAQRYISNSGLTFIIPYKVGDGQFKPLKRIWNFSTYIEFASLRGAKISRNYEKSLESIRAWLEGKGKLYDESSDAIFYYCVHENCYEITESAAKRFAKNAKYIIIDSYAYSFILTMMPWQTCLAEPLANQANLYIYRVIYPQQHTNGDEHDTEVVNLGNHRITNIRPISTRNWNRGVWRYQLLLAIGKKIIVEHPEHEDLEIRLRKPEMLLFVHKTRWSFIE